MKTFLSLCTGVLCTATLSAATVFQVPDTRKAPAIDGKITPGEWDSALRIAGSGGFSGREVDHRRCELLVSSDREKLYIAMISENPLNGTPLINPSRLGPTYDDSIELWLAPGDGRDAGEYQFGTFQLIVNSAGDLYARHHDPGFGLPTKLWKNTISRANGIANGVWTLEIAIPWRELGFAVRPAVFTLPLLPVRNMQYPGKQVPFTDVTGFMDSKGYARFRFGGETLAGASLYAGNERIPGVFSVRNCGAETRRVTLSATVNGEKTERELTVAPGRNAVVNLLNAPRPGMNALSLSAAADGKTFFTRDFKFNHDGRRVWQNSESHLVLAQSFNAPIQKPEIGAPGVISGQLVATAGRTTNSKALQLSKSGDGISYPKTAIPVPGAVSMWVRTEKRPGKEYRRFFSSQFRSGGYIFFQESNGFSVLGAHHFNRKNVNCLFAGVTAPAEWTHYLFNINHRNLEIYVNGNRKGALEFPVEVTAEKLGCPVIGISGQNGFAVSGFQIFDRLLSVGEISAMAQGERSVNGAISYLPGDAKLGVELFFDRNKLAKYSSLVLEMTGGGKTHFSNKLNLDAGRKLSGGGINVLRDTFKLPPLADGNYIVTVSGVSGANKATLMEKAVKVKKYAWVGNKLGDDDILIPPFTALTAKGGKLNALLREYDLGSGGFPRQITAAGRDILAGPVTLTADGKLAPGEFKVTKSSPTEISFSGSAANDKIKARIVGKMEQDGFIRYDVTFQSLGKTTPRQIFLEIPLKKEFATLFHAVGEHIRANPAGFIPRGTGRIWKSRSIPQPTRDNFIPYIWIGDDERGISFAADSDRNWAHSAQSDAAELWRDKDGTVSIRINLLNAPYDLKDERTITFALMASPVKPMPKNYRGWSDFFGTPGVRYTRVLLSNPYWGCFYGWTGRYPAFEDFGYMRKLNEALQTGKVDQNYINSWVKRTSEAASSDVPILKNMGGKNYVVRHAGHAFNAMAAMHKHKDHFKYAIYTCNWSGSNTLPEYPVFADEWKHPSHVVRSFADYALYYFDKMLDTGLGGIYLDNTFFVAREDVLNGNGYVAEDGTTRPSFGLWRIREYHKRLATLMAARGMEPYIVVHHTNGNVLPTLSFATNAMGMEWKYGLSDFQTRFSPDYIRAVNQGRQGGFFATSLDGLTGDPKLKAWPTRTMLAMLLPHEIRPTAGIGTDMKVYGPIAGILWNFGTHCADVAHFPYWSPESPVKSSDPGLLATSYLRGDKLLIVAGDYNARSPVSLTIAGREITAADDAETGEKIEFTKNTLLLPFRTHDIRLLLVTLR